MPIPYEPKNISPTLPTCGPHGEAVIESPGDGWAHISDGQAPAQNSLAEDGPDYGFGCDVNPMCGCHIRSRCDGCGHCTVCVGCHCGEDGA